MVGFSATLEGFSSCQVCKLEDTRNIQIQEAALAKFEIMEHKLK